VRDRPHRPSPHPPWIRHYVEHPTDGLINETLLKLRQEKNARFAKMLYGQRVHPRSAGEGVPQIVSISVAEATTADASVMMTKRFVSRRRRRYEYGGV